MKTLIFVLAAFLIIIMIRAYSKSSTWKNKAELTLALALVPVSVGAVFVTKEFWRFLASIDSSPIYQLGIIPVFFLVALLISCTFIALAAWKKGGIRKLKRASETGLISNLIIASNIGLFGGLVIGLIVGSILGLTYELISGVVGGSVDELANGLVSGLIGGSATGLIVGLILGLAYGWKEESWKESLLFENPTPKESQIVHIK